MPTKLHRRYAAGLPAPALLGLAVLLGCDQARGYEVTISTGSRALYLQVGTGGMSGRYEDGGTPGNNASINSVTATVTADTLGSGPLRMSTNSSVNNSPYDGFNYCDSGAGAVYVGGFYRTPGAAGSAASLTVNTPPSLVGTGGATIPFSTISWVSGGQDDTGAPAIRSGTFTSGTQTIANSIPRNTWFEGCLTFTYANDQMQPAGTFTGRATYQLAAP
ncbi:hypothetical protein [Variovorax rhizosphaerae]|uniref:DUF4402 domain-containing protein n=1 Tax=Variovorax rhizosphaerae TaxID=1836200 RepID=A0ABU8WHW7_9BURK